jgi:purine-binding chemotaxis protein CheW
MKADLEHQRDFGADPARSVDEASQKQYVTFSVAEQNYAVDILMVREIRLWTGATRLPNAKPHMRGVINLRGAIIPVVDLGALFQVVRSSAPATQVIVIVEAQGFLKGLLVDHVSDIVSLAPEQIAPLPHGETETPNPLFTGLIHGENGLVAIIALNNLELVDSPTSFSETAAA